MFSPKGGVGTTTIATNLAMLAGRAQPEVGTLLIDLDLSFGQVVVAPQPAAEADASLELARDDAALREPELFRTYMVPHPSGIQVLAAPLAPGFASLIDAERVELVLERALEAFDIVIVDAGTTFDDRMLAISSRSDTVIVPVLPEIPALNAVHLLMDQLTRDRRAGRDDRVRAQQRVLPRPPQAVGHRERAGRADQRATSPTTRSPTSRR